MDIVVERPFIIPLELLGTAKPLKMAWIPPGKFLMGKPIGEHEYDEDGPQFEAIISRGYWLGQFTVTQAQWSVVMNDNPSQFRDGGINHPVENINWFRANDFCHLLNQQFEVALPGSYRFGLPTEAQWEYACKAGVHTRYCSGDTFDDLSRVAWHKGNSSDQTHSVGEKEPNNWGLFDIHGNVMEWCEDSPSEYPSVPSVDWVGRGSGKARNIRGGSWRTNPDDSSFLCTSRGYVEPSLVRPWLGLRLCLKSISP